MIGVVLEPDRDLRHARASRPRPHAAPDRARPDPDRAARAADRPLRPAGGAPCLGSLSRRTVAAVLAFAASIAFIVLAPHWDKVGYIKGAQMGTYFIAILGLNIVTGYTGQISLAQGAFMAVGGYTTAFLVTARRPRPLDDPDRGARRGRVRLPRRSPALRLSGLYLALVTFGLARRDARPDLVGQAELGDERRQADPALRQQASARPGVQRREPPRPHAARSTAPSTT